MTDSQSDLFITIFFKEHRRSQFIGPTQYGKSEIISMALILRSIMFREPWWIITGQQKKSDIIMQKVITHLFDHEYLISSLVLDQSTPLDRLKKERSKERLVWKDGGEIRAVTADAKNRKRVVDTLTGLGNENILEDEASLIPDDLQSMIMRMLGGYEGGYLIKVGNPFINNHFKRSWNNPNYHKVFIDYHTALAEGRYTLEFIEEMRGEAFFEVLYECKFPDDTAIDSDGYYRLLTDEELNEAYEPEFKQCRENPGKDASEENRKRYEEELEKYGENLLGIDPSEGGDDNAGVVRNKKYAKVVHKSKLSDLMAMANEVVKLIKEYRVPNYHTFVDRVGVGAGLFSRLKELVKVTGVRWGEKAYKDTFVNNKAEQFWKLREWIKGGGKVCDKALLDELRTIKYKEDSNGKVKIKSKEDMRKEGIPSPNLADALAMTFEKVNTGPKIITL